MLWGTGSKTAFFGGVVVFDRLAELDEDENENLTREPPNVYLHPCRSTVTSRVTQLLDDQQQALVDFLLNGQTAPGSKGDRGGGENGEEG